MCEITTILLTYKTKNSNVHKPLKKSENILNIISRLENANILKCSLGILDLYDYFLLGYSKK